MESTAAAQPPPPPPAPPPPPLEQSWQVQVAAFKTRPEADAIRERLQGLEIAAQVIREGTWFKVRAGPFADRARAQQALTRIRREFGEGPFLVPPR
jgi:cell division protein FtsN